MRRFLARRGNIHLLALSGLVCAVSSLVEETYTYFLFQVYCAPFPPFVERSTYNLTFRSSQPSETVFRFHGSRTMTAHITDLTQLSWYGVSSETGFVPDLVTASSLPSHFALVEGLTSDPPLAEAISLSILREKVHALPQYQLENYAQLSLSEKRRLLVILTFVAHGYVWGNGDDLIMNRLPESIAIPLEYLSKDLGTAPLGTYASTVLWNSRLKNDAKNWSLDNVSIDFTFTGTKDEIWFYQVRCGLLSSEPRAVDG